MAMLYDDFKPVVDLVLNNWTALQLAVEHGMGAPGGKETAQLMSVYITRFCVENDVDNYEIQEVIEDLMDEEFETTCYDESPKEIANLLVHFLDLLKQGQREEVKTQLDAMPKCQMWLSQALPGPIPPQSHGNPNDDTTSSSEDENLASGVAVKPTPPSANHQTLETSSENRKDEPMDEDSDPGWTVVKTKRK